MWNVNLFIFFYFKKVFFSFVLFVKLKEYERNGLLYYKYIYYLFYIKVFI